MSETRINRSKSLAHLFFAIFAASMILGVHAAYGVPNQSPIDVKVVLYNDKGGDGIDAGDLLSDPHVVEVSGVGQFTTGGTFSVSSGTTVDFRLRRGGVVGPWQQATFPDDLAAGDEWQLEFATVDVVLYNDDEGDGIDVGDHLSDPHRVEVSGIAQFVTGDTFHVPPGANLSFRLRRDGVVGPWQATQFDAGGHIWQLEFATVNVVLYNDEAGDGIDPADLLSDPHRVEVSGIAQFVTGDTFHVPPGANISFRLRRDGVVGPWQATQFDAGDYIWELEFATVNVVLYNDEAGDGIDPADLLSDPNRVEVSGIAQFVTGDTFHVPPGANVSFRLRRGGVVGPWQVTQFLAGDQAWELEFATVHIHLCGSSQSQVEVSGAGTFNDGDVMHVPAGTNISFRIREGGNVGPWQTTQFSAGDTDWYPDGACLGTIIVEKQTDPDGDPTSFTFSGDAAGSIADDGQIVVSGLLPGTYTSAELVPPGWTLTSITLDDGASATPSSGDITAGVATFRLDPGETVKAVFTNTMPGTIIIEKVVNLDCVDHCDGPPTFTFSGDIAGSITHGEQIVVNNLLPGEYTSTELAPGDWFIASITVDDNNSSFVISGDAKSGTVTFRVEAGETVKAVFTNTKPSVTVSLTSGPGGRVTSPGEGDFEYCMGTTICLDAEATDPLFDFVGWRGSFFTNVGPDCSDATTTGLGSVCGGASYGAVVPACAGCTPLKVTHDHHIKAVFISRLDTLYVDDDSPGDPAPCDNSSSDPNENGTAEHPFDSIQEAIEVAHEGARILVDGGVYREQIDFMGKCIRVEGLWLSDPNVTQEAVVDGNGLGPVVTFSGGEDANCVLAGLRIQGGYAPYAAAIACSGSPTIVNCSIVGNRATYLQAAVIHCGNSSARFINCTITENAGDSQGALMVCIDSDVSVINSILWGNTPSVIDTISGAAPTITYCDIEGGWTGDGNIDVDPAFVVPGFWTEAGIIGWPVDDIWMAGDYHLQSEAGHWDAATGTYIKDAASSPCIDTGDPTSVYTAEPVPNGDRINVGAYGGTSQASLSGQ